MFKTPISLSFTCDDVGIHAFWGIRWESLDLPGRILVLV